MSVVVGKTWREGLSILGLTAEQAGIAVEPKSKSHPSGFRSKWEALYATDLDFQKQLGEIVAWEHECLRFKLANGAWYKPDFAVWLPDGRLRLVEIKGYRRTAAIVRFKVAASKYPLCEWWMIRREKNQWVRML